MKTVNKILLTALGIILVAIVLFFITLRIELSRDAHKGSGQIVTEERTLIGFTEIEARGNLVIHLEQSDNNAVTIETDDNLIEFIETRVRRGRLQIRITEPVHSNSRINLYVQFEDLYDIEGNAGSHFISKSGIQGEVLTKDLSSGAKSTMSLFYDELNLKLKSGAFSKLSGMVPNFSVEASSGSILDGRQLTTEVCDARSKSGAEITVYVTESLTANASSGGFINYFGNPSHKSWNTSSGGQIIQK